MAFKKKFVYLTETDKDSIEEICRALRRSSSSRKNLFYIVANYGEFLEGSVFDSTSSDAKRYVDYLKGEVVAGRLQEKYCACLFFELRSFFDRLVAGDMVCDNPFGGYDNPFRFPDKLRSEDLPKLSDVDTLLGTCSDELECYVAVLLALRMGLTVSEIAVIEKKQFCLNEKDGDIYLKMWRWDNGEKRELFLYVPRDIVPHIKEQVLSTPEDYAHLFRSKKTKKTPTVRAMQLRLGKIQEGLDFSISFSQLRSLCLYLMLLEQIPVQDICRYAGIRGDWLTRYDEIPETLIADASKYVNIRIL